MSHLMLVVYGLVLLFFQSAAPGDRSFSGGATHQQIDSLVLVRQAGYFEEVRPEADLTYGYKVVVTSSGTVRFEVQDDQRLSGEAFEVESASLERILGTAEQIELEGVPESLIGKEPWCKVVMTDAPFVTIAIFEGSGVRRVTDYQGCSVEGDASDDRLIARLRELEDTATRLLELEERFAVAPLT